MRKILTANDIRLYHQQGIKTIPIEKIPQLTDLAREELARLGMQIATEGAPAAASSSDTPRTDGAYPSASLSPAACACKKKPFRDVIRGPGKLLGAFISTPHPVLAEFMGRVGFDFLVIDSEHSAMHRETVQSMLQGVAATPAYGMVRVPGISYEAIAGALDSGADALLIPQIRTLDDIQRIKEFSLYPPDGRRGAGPSRSTTYGCEIEKLADDPNAETNIVVQIETLEALKNLDRILSADFIDMYFIGPGDLSMDMGIFGQFANPRLLEAAAVVRGKTRQAGKKLGIFAGNFEAAQAWLEQGFDMVIINSDLGILGQYISSHLPRLRESVSKI